ncbi:MAG: hypothetical protein A2W00_10785 [Candidatus Eisenbacteria bacterium RBG_16_71_46]|nr:MAG: hypothetical protein A2W00_10785 [Candidatus Eisenbacteria bacterium RBG_16_71_46]OGF23516.1 MAG: hypothetical protein A2V63_11840 [Candidatus Eisenbacteria bacterium RBG_19FT_COMBO_70_11]
MTGVPVPLAEVLEDIAHLDRRERAETLIDYADRFREVPPAVATRPFPEQHRVPACESDAFVWSSPRPDGTLQFHFAVENPQGISARALCALLDETLSGQPLEQVAKVSPEIVFALFGAEVTMGKGQGLMGIVDLVTREARQRLSAGEAPPRCRSR